MGAEAQSQNAAYQAQIARNNAIAENYKQINAINAGRQQAQSASLTNAARMAGIKSSIAASGVDVNTGSPVNVLQSQREVGQLNTENVYQNAAMQGWGYQVAAMSDTAQANLYQAESSQAMIGGMFGAAGSLLGNAKVFGGGSSGTSSTGIDVLSSSDNALGDSLLTGVA